MALRRSWLVVSLVAAALLVSAATQAGAQTTANSKIRLQYLMSFHADFVAPVDIGQLTTGHRQIFVISGGTFDGPKLKGKVLPGPVDWFLTTPDGVGRMDVRGAFQTEDGANVYMRYQGVQVWTESAGAKLAKGLAIDFGEIYWVANPVFETGDPRYAWLNNIMTVAEGRLGPSAGWVEYRIFQVLD